MLFQIPDRGQVLFSILIENRRTLVPVLRLFEIVKDNIMCLSIVDEIVVRILDT